MQPRFWQPPVELSAKEEHVVNRIRKAKLFVFLREYRHQIFDEAFQQEFAALYQDSKQGQPPIAPTQLALATIFQAYMGVSDDEAVEAVEKSEKLEGTILEELRKGYPLGEEILCPARVKVSVGNS